MIDLYSYGRRSISARKLVDALGASCLHRGNSGGGGRRRWSKCINWGSRKFIPSITAGTDVLNNCWAVGNAISKTTAFTIWKSQNVPTVDATTDKDEAASWLSAGFKVYGRDLSRASQGRGIIVYSSTGHELGRHLFYTKGFNTRTEYRIHIGLGAVLDITQKKRRNGHENSSMDVRSHDNGWIFARNNIIVPPTSLISAAEAAVRSLGLDFGAVDCAVNSQLQPCIFEVNTAPGIEGTTLTKYVDFFRSLADAR